MKILCPVFFTSVERMNQKRAGERRWNYFRLEEGKNPVRKQGSSQPVKASSVRDQGGALLGPWWGPLWPDSLEAEAKDLQCEEPEEESQNRRGSEEVEKHTVWRQKPQRLQKRNADPTLACVSMRSHFWERRCLQRPGWIRLQKAEVQDSVSDMQVEFWGRKRVSSKAEGEEPPSGEEA